MNSTQGATVAESAGAAYRALLRHWRWLFGLAALPLVVDIILIFGVRHALAAAPPLAIDVALRVLHVTIDSYLFACLGLAVVQSAWHGADEMPARIDFHLSGTGWAAFLYMFWFGLPVALIYALPLEDDLPDDDLTAYTLVGPILVYLIALVGTVYLWVRLSGIWTAIVAGAPAPWRAAWAAGRGKYLHLFLLWILCTAPYLVFWAPLFFVFPEANGDSWEGPVATGLAFAVLDYVCFVIWWFGLAHAFAAWRAAETPA